MHLRLMINFSRPVEVGLTLTYTYTSFSNIFCPICISNIVVKLSITQTSSIGFDILNCF